MSRKGKLIDRFLSIPSDLTWDEFVKILAFYGYAEIRTGKTGGSRRRFIDKSEDIIITHEPHPAKIIKKYVIREVIAKLKKKGVIQDE